MWVRLRAGARARACGGKVTVEQEGGNITYEAHGALEATNAEIPAALLLRTLRARDALLGWVAHVALIGAGHKELIAHEMLEFDGVDVVAGILMEKHVHHQVHFVV